MFLIQDCLFLGRQPSIHIGAQSPLFSWHKTNKQSPCEVKFPCILSSKNCENFDLYVLLANDIWYLKEKEAAESQRSSVGLSPL